METAVNRPYIHASATVVHAIGTVVRIYFWDVVLAAQLFCWTGQFVGHEVFEKRAPALLDNLTQAFLMAPFFVLLEVILSFFGYELYPGFHSKVKTTIYAKIKEWQENK
ncbi:2-hydroxy-palmitic acid dioxygenase mpo1-like [Capsicum annuum]|uniref:2-hydroxy-palmitic acid dioxygenase mpo1-like n=1 Tax=Capsicum annuum TaxID=4072 RepID=UPI001FB0F8FA|nr:2-hydroxy-palmitic acid dioxygenase mpo1-like [Capsicum annuum]